MITFDEQFDDIHEYALILNEELEKGRTLNPTKDVTIKFDKKGRFIGLSYSSKTLDNTQSKKALA